MTDYEFVVQLIVVMGIYTACYIGAVIFSKIKSKRKISRLQSETDQNMDNIE